MSTMAARAHHDATLSAPPLRRAQPARRPASRLSGLARMIARRPGRAAVMLLFAMAAGAILINALVFQKTRHPAPIVSGPANAPVRAVERRVDQPAPMQAPAAAPVGVPALLPPSRPSDLSQAARESAPRPPAAVTSVARNPAAPAPTPARNAAPRDPIADLINGADIRPPGEIRGVAAARPTVARRTAEN